MRSPYDDFAVGETKRNSNNQYNNNNNNNTFNNNHNSTIPYHARENSLPFSYGQISKTSTPLRPIVTGSRTNNNNNNTYNSPGYKNGIQSDFNFDFDFGLNTEYTGGSAGDNNTTVHSVNYNVLNRNGKDVNYNYKLMAHGGELRKSENRYFCGSDSNFNHSATAAIKPNITRTTTTTTTTTTTSTSSSDEIDASRMIKTQPRLTSPLLVRKTLSNNSSRSPTRSTTNTIANTYHYSYGNNNNNSIGGGGRSGSSVGDNFDKFNVNGNINQNSNNNYAYNNNNNNNTHAHYNNNSEIQRKTSTRYDFEDLLRERREKVFTEYRATTHDVSLSPVPPPRRFANGSIQLPSTLPTSTSRRARSPQLSARSQSQSRNYNYDFEFNLNLDDVDGRLWTQRSRTLERSPQRPLQKLKQQQQQQQQYQQQHQQLYETRDIPLTSTYVEHNYHTISSSSPTNATTMKSNNNNNNINHISRENAMFDIYATPYDKRKRVMEPLEALATATATAAGTSASTLRSKRSDYSATYGNDHLYGHEQHSNIGQMTDRASSPIYATSTKKVNAAALSTLPSSVTFANSVGGNGGGSADSSTSSNNVASALTITDYPTTTTTTTTSTMIRPETPAFPVTPRTPYAPKANGYPQRTQQHTLTELHNYSAETIYGNNYRPRLNSTISMANSEPQEVAAHLVKFAKDSSKFWYKPNLSREEAISLLVNASPGTFVVRDSTTYKNAYGLVLRVAQPPPGTTSTGKPDELVRHFLIEPTTRGVRLKGCANEPVFTSLSALVYEHSTNQLALPCLLNIPDRDLVPPLIEPTAAQKQLMTQGAACNVLWLFSCDTESLTGEEAIRKAIRQMYAQTQSPAPTEVHFKVTQQGITLTDNTRKKFFRKHYTAETISYCAIDPDHRLWTMQEHGNDNTTVLGALKKTIFAFVARCSPSSKDNQCHVFCDLAINQPASAIVSFVNKTLPTEKQKNYVL
uniref:SH2 domain-containing protein n=1 Tax=Glossina palpalis gambiensis TaxID=67801 RepID=A0A1B0BSP3_9MUSC